jgi:hypothetical protein
VERDEASREAKDRRLETARDSEEAEPGRRFVVPRPTDREEESIKPPTSRAF